MGTPLVVICNCDGQIRGICNSGLKELTRNFKPPLQNRLTPSLSFRRGRSMTFEKIIVDTIRVSKTKVSAVAYISIPLVVICNCDGQIRGICNSGLEELSRNFKPPLQNRLTPSLYFRRGRSMTFEKIIVDTIRVSKTTVSAVGYISIVFQPYFSRRVYPPPGGQVSNLLQ